MRLSLTHLSDIRHEDSLRIRAEHQLAQLPSSFVQMVFLSLKRSDKPSAARSLFGLDCWIEECEKIVAELHLRVFRHWLGLDLREKRTDLQPYLDTLPSGGAFPPTIRFLQFCHDMAPMEASLNEMKLFLASIEVLATLNRNAATQRCRPRTTMKFEGAD